MSLLRKQKLRQRPQRTPSSNKSVYAYYNKRDPRSEATSRQAPKEPKPTRKKQRIFQHIPSLLLVCAVVVSFLYLSTVDSHAKVVVKDDDKNTTQLRSIESYQSEAQNFISHSVVNHSKFTFDSGGLVDHLKQTFPELATVSVSLPIMGRRPVVNVQTTRPAFILSSPAASVLVGNNGVALVNVKDVQNLSALNLRTVIDESGIDIEAGKPALPQEQATFISVVVEQLEKQNIQIDTLTIPKSPYDLQVRIKGAPYYVKFNILEDAKQQSGSFLALKQMLEAEKVTPKEYIDVRVGERVFYK